MDCVVIGGGIIGMLTARELVQQGLSVTLIERRETGSEASWAGGGILSPLYPWRYPEAVNALTRLSQALHPALARELLEETGIDPEWVQSGCLMLDVADQTEALAWAVSRSIELQPLSDDAAHSLEPALRVPTGGALWMPHVAQIRNPRLLKALSSSLHQRGVRIHEHSPVQALLIQNGEFRGVQTAAGPVLARQGVLAAGAWSAGLLQPLGKPPDIAPVRGQMILFRGPPELVRHIVMTGPHYLIPRRDGHILAGSTLERVGFDKSTTQAARHELRSAALYLIPHLTGCNIVAHWAGLRPGSPAGIPFIGPHSTIQGLYVNTGHYRNGLLLAPASARLLAELMLECTPSLNPTPYSLEAKREDRPWNP
jgi:glycine oxidase